jgi:ABC-type sugar transport system ATPase subunit
MENSHTSKVGCNPGRLVQIRCPMDVYRSPANIFVEGFLGSPPMNLLPASLEQGATIRFGLQSHGSMGFFPE